MLTIPTVYQQVYLKGDCTCRKDERESCLHNQAGTIRVLYADGNVLVEHPAGAVRLFNPHVLLAAV